jgi:hypothetical protein
MSQGFMRNMLIAIQAAFIVDAKLPRKLKKAFKKIQISEEYPVYDKEGRTETFTADVLNIRTKQGRKAARLMEKSFYKTVARIKTEMLNAKPEEATTLSEKV